MRPICALLSSFALLLLTTGVASGKPLTEAEKRALLEDIASGARPVVERAIEKLRFGGQPRDVLGRVQQLTRHDEVGPRRNAVYVLSVLVPPFAGPALVQALADEDAVVRQYACAALGKLKDLRATVPLAKLVRDPTVSVRKEAIRALGKIGDGASGKALVEALDDAEESVRLAAVLAIGEVREPKAVPKLLPLLTSPSEQTRHAAARSLCLLGHAEGRRYLEKLLASSEPTERRDAIGLLDGVRVPWVTQALIRSLGDKDLDVRVSAARGLSRAGDGRGVQWLVLAASRGTVEEQLRVETVIEELGVSKEDRRKILALSKP
jgi:HEAT repeat protein